MEKNPDNQHKLLGYEDEFSKLKPTELVYLYLHCVDIIDDLYITPLGIDEYLGAFDFYVQLGRECSEGDSSYALVDLARLGYIHDRRENGLTGERVCFDAGMCACAALRLLVKGLPDFKAGRFDGLIDVSTLLACGYLQGIDECVSGFRRPVSDIVRVVNQNKGLEAAKKRNARNGRDGLCERVIAGYQVANQKTGISKNTYLKGIIGESWLHYKDGTRPSERTVREWLKNAEQVRKPKVGRPKNKTLNTNKNQNVK